LREHKILKTHKLKNTKTQKHKTERAAPSGKSEKRGGGARKQNRKTRGAAAPEISFPREVPHFLRVHGLSEYGRLPTPRAGSAWGGAGNFWLWGLPWPGAESAWGLVDRLLFCQPVEGGISGGGPSWGAPSPQAAPPYAQADFPRASMPHLGCKGARRGGEGGLFRWAPGRIAKASQARTYVVSDATQISLEGSYKGAPLQGGRDGVFYGRPGVGAPGRSEYRYPEAVQGGGVAYF